MKNGFTIINGKITTLPVDLFDVPSKEREDVIIKNMTEELMKVIDDKINIQYNKKKLQMNIKYKFIFGFNSDEQKALAEKAYEILSDAYPELDGLYILTDVGLTKRNRYLTIEFSNDIKIPIEEIILNSELKDFINTEKPTEVTESYTYLDCMAKHFETSDEKSKEAVELIHLKYNTSEPFIEPEFNGYEGYDAEHWNIKIQTTSFSFKLKKDFPL